MVIPSVAPTRGTSPIASEAFAITSSDAQRQMARYVPSSRRYSRVSTGSNPAARHWPMSSARCARNFSTWSGASVYRWVRTVGVIRSPFGVRPTVSGRIHWLCPASAHRLLHERGDPLLVGGRELRQEPSARPHGALFEIGRLVEPKRRVPLLVLRGRLKEANDFALLGVGGQPVPGPRDELRRGLLEDGVDALGHDPIRWRHRGDLLLHVALALFTSTGRVAARGTLALPHRVLQRGLLCFRKDVRLLAGCGGCLLRHRLTPFRLRSRFGRP